MIAYDARMLTRILVASLLLAGACKKSNDAKPTAGSAAPAAPAGSAAPGSAAATPAPTAPADSLDAASYEARAGKFMQDFTNVFADAGTDCDKLAAGVNKFIDDNKPLIVQMKEYENGHPEAKTALDDRMQAEYKKQQDTMLPALQACAEEQSVQDALARFDELE